MSQTLEKNAFNALVQLGNPVVEIGVALEVQPINLSQVDQYHIWRKG
jgi:hypothetical protein